jgi:hypothetical protein
VIRADPAGKLFAAIGAGNLRAWVDRRDAAGQAALSNLVLSAPTAHLGRADRLQASDAEGGERVSTPIPRSQPYPGEQVGEEHDEHADPHATGFWWFSGHAASVTFYSVGTTS